MVFQDYKTPRSDKMFLMLLEALKTGIQVRVYETGKCNVNGHSEFMKRSPGFVPIICRMLSRIWSYARDVTEVTSAPPGIDWNRNG